MGHEHPSPSPVQPSGTCEAVSDGWSQGLGRWVSWCTGPHNDSRPQLCCLPVASTKCHLSTPWAEHGRMGRQQQQARGTSTADGKQKCSASAPLPFARKGFSARQAQPLNKPSPPFSELNAKWRSRSMSVSFLLGRLRLFFPNLYSKFPSNLSSTFTFANLSHHQPK